MMKHFILAAICAFTFVVALGQTPKTPHKQDGSCCAASSSSKAPKLCLEKDSYDFGRIDSKGKPVSYTFEFTNKGNSPLVITKATTSCTCTKISFTKKPVKPGEKGVITVTYDPKKQSGTFAKTIQVQSNGEPKKCLIVIKGDVF